MIRKAEILDIEPIKKLIDSSDEMNSNENTFTLDCFKRIIKN